MLSNLTGLERWTARPVAPGVYLGDLLRKLDITQDAFATAIRTSRFTVNQIINGQRSVTTAMAFKLAKATSTTPDFWLNLQRNIDAYDAYQSVRDELNLVEVVRPPATVVIHRLP